MIYSVTEGMGVKSVLHFNKSILPRSQIENALCGSNQLSNQEFEIYETSEAFVDDLDLKPLKSSVCIYEKRLGFDSDSFPGTGRSAWPAFSSHMPF